MLNFRLCARLKPLFLWGQGGRDYESTAIGGSSFCRLDWKLCWGWLFSTTAYFLLLNIYDFGSANLRRRNLLARLCLNFRRHFLNSYSKKPSILLVDAIVCMYDTALRICLCRAPATGRIPVGSIDADLRNFH